MLYSVGNVDTLLSYVVKCTTAKCFPVFPSVSQCLGVDRKKVTEADGRMANWENILCSQL